MKLVQSIFYNLSVFLLLLNCTEKSRFPRNPVNASEISGGENDKPQDVIIPEDSSLTSSDSITSIVPVGSSIEGNSTEPSETQTAAKTKTAPSAVSANPKKPAIRKIVKQTPVNGSSSISKESGSLKVSIGNLLLPQFDDNPFSIVEITPNRSIESLSYVASAYSNYPYRVIIKTDRNLSKNNKNPYANQFYMVGSALFAENLQDPNGAAFQMAINNYLIGIIQKKYNKKVTTDSALIKRMDVYILTELALGARGPDDAKDYFQ